MRSFAVIAAAPPLLGACAQQPASRRGRAALPGSNVQVPGFLGDYNEFTRVPGQP